MRTSRELSEYDTYHLMARGVGKQIIFEDDKDYEQMLALIDKYLGKRGNVLAWCLMSNHIHLLVELEMSQLSREMRKLLSSYAIYFNLRHGRVGHLFQGRFESRAIDSEQYLLEALRYIHQNPVKGNVTKTCDYKWSSYRTYINSPSPRYQKWIKDFFGSESEFVKFNNDFDSSVAIEVSVPRPRVGDEEALEIAKGLLGENPAKGIHSMTKGARDNLLCVLHDRRLSQRQIQRITGVGRGIIQRVISRKRSA